MSLACMAFLAVIYGLLALLADICGLYGLHLRPAGLLGHLGRHLWPAEFSGAVSLRLTAFCQGVGLQPTQGDLPEGGPPWVRWPARWPRTRVR